ncbi:DNA polymerase [Turkeypox virus]|uniref:DNA polymerase n=3 Tax=Turkeypox virus TaxID=336486 RepID=A0A0M3ZCQ4_9POXV|nr:DNA polymerase [Turkeypox virus]ALA62442.1 DNA polymerase [Turkeypox virus]
MDIRCVNWFENKGDIKYIYLKAITKSSTVIFIRFDYNYHYVYDTDTELDFTPIDSSELGQFNIIDIDEIVDKDIRDVVDRKTYTKHLRLVKDNRKNRQKGYLSEYLDITWFYLLNSIKPDGCYEINMEKLSAISRDCYHCKEPNKLFTKEIPLFDIKYTYLCFDIECQFDKKFPSVFVNPISHISCLIIDTKREYKFSLINTDLLDDKSPTINHHNDFSPATGLTFCTEIVMLNIMKRILEHRFDFIITFNGNNFDIRYITGRLEILEKKFIYFSLPDKSETIKLKIFERFQSGGTFTNKTYHINNNNGAIFFDLYAFIQKTERLESYKLDNISKNIFNCIGTIKDMSGNILTIEANTIENSKDKLDIFITVLSTGNYITIDNLEITEILDKNIQPDKFVIKVYSNKQYDINTCHLISFGKDDVDLKQMYNNYNLETAIKMEKYCIHDACLCKYIWDYYRVPSKINAASSTYLLPQCLALEYRASTLIKGPLLKLLLDERIVYQRVNSKVKYPYIGGKVFMPSQKTFENNVMIFDYNSLYPNVCVYANLSPETLVCVVLSSNKLESEINIKTIKAKYPYPDYIYVICESRLKGYYNEIVVYDRRKEGIIPKLLNIFMLKRKTYKKLLKDATTTIETALYDSLQYIYKIIANSVYGLMGFNNSILYSYSSAKACTTIGRNMIMYLDSVMNGAVWENDKLVLADFPRNIFSGEVIFSKEIPVTQVDGTFKFRSVYGDTDSIFSEISSKDVEKTLAIARILEQVINTKVLYGNFRIEFEAIYTQLILQSKKKYTTIKYSAAYKPGDKPIRINKGTSETRRDVALFHKHMIQKYKDLLMKALMESDTKNDITRTILQHLETDMVKEFSYNTDFEKYLLSRKHHNNYKCITHSNFELVKKYNIENTEKIEIGERYFYIYICDASLPWQKKLCNIQSYETIADSKFSLPYNKRIFYEVYFKRIAAEVVNLLPDKTICTLFFTRLFATKPTFALD